MFFYYPLRTVLVALALTTAWPAGARANDPNEGPSAGKTTKTGQPAQASAAPAAAANAATPAQMVQLRGMVLTPDGRPCAGASVYPAGQPRQLVVTDAQGNFTLPVPAGTALSLQVEYFGLGSSRVAIDTPSAEPLHITLGK